MAKNKEIITATKRPSFVRRALSWVWRKKWWIIIIAIVLIAVNMIFGGAKKAQKEAYSSVEITYGDIRQIVSATGEIQPVNTVNVGSQVSGTIDNIYVDYNSKVKKGDVLLTIEPSVLQAQVEEAKASLNSAESKARLAKSEYERDKILYSSDYISRAEMEQAQAAYEQANQDVVRMKSQYERAKTNLGYATISSPVDGTVISRKVDVGQTVAASFQTPDLFEIAEDLTKMQIETSVSEADIGVIKEGQKVTFTVDAYPNKTFEGTVHQIRLSPTTTSNVVVYTVVIAVDNSDLSLMPGMTAFVTIVIDEKFDVYKTQNSAFLVRSFDGLGVETNGATPNTHIAILRNGKISFIPYTKGLVTATETEIISDEIQAGDRIVVGKVGAGASKKPSSNRGGVPGPGGPMR